MFKNKKLMIVMCSALIGMLIAIGIVFFIHVHKENGLKAEAKACVEARLATWKASGESFAEQYILGGVTVSEEMRASYNDTCEEMLSLMRYEVTNVTKEEELYRVTVQYQSADIYQQFLNAIEAHADRFLKEATKEDYSVKKESKIAAQIQENYLTEVCQLLKDACAGASYGEKETMEFEVSVEENGEFTVEEGQISQFVVKILNIDEIQD